MISELSRRRFTTVFIALTLAATALGTPKPRRAYRITTPDGVQVAVQEWGNPAGPEIVFIHGLAQSHLSWTKQVEGRLARDFRLVTYDLRGHGDSDAPLEAEKYQSGEAWGDELDAVIKAARLRKPLLVGWSYGGLVIADYLRTHGPSRIAGIAFVDSMLKMETKGTRESSDLLRRAVSDDLASRIDGRTAFLRACFRRPPSAKEFETQLAFNMIPPSPVILAMVQRPIDNDAVARSTKLPTLVIHGTHDALIGVAAARHTAKTFPSARLRLYPDSGHAPFFESATRFNSDLAAFARSTRG